MAEIELVIKIDEELYNDIKSLPFTTFAEDIIINGTPLPKGHRDLIERRCGNNVCNGCEHSDICDTYNAPTIIEGSESE